MLEYAIDTEFLNKQANHGVETLCLPADRSAGPNKNRFPFMYLKWHTTVGLNTAIVLVFMVAGPTRKLVEAAFGHIEVRLKTNDPVVLWERLQVMANSSTTNFCIPSAKVIWRQCRLVLEKHFNVSALFDILKYNYFIFEKWKLEILVGKSFSLEEEEKIFNLH